MKSPIVARQFVYSDIDLTAKPHPNTNDVLKKIDLQAIKQSVRNILLTNKGEKPFDPNFGGGLRSFLFENFNSVSVTLLETNIRIALENYEPRVRVTEVDISDLVDKNAIRVSVSYTVKSPEGETDIAEVIVERLR